MSEPELADMEEEMCTREEDSFSNSAEGSSDDEDADEEKIDAVEKLVQSEPYKYDHHVELISLCRKWGYLERLRIARENMSRLFPLTPELWIDWLADEKTLAFTAEQKEKIIPLFKRAVKDYPSVSVWLDYVQFCIGNIGDTWVMSGIQTVRETFEQACTAVGLHVPQGCLIWESYREFEKAFLQFLKVENAQEEKIQEQEDRIYDLYKRQLSIPLLAMDQTYNEFKEKFKDSKRYDVPAVEHSYKKALQKFNKLKEFEADLFESETPHYEQYRAYIEYEKKEGEPIRVQNIYERAIVDNCLKEELWIDYGKYMDRVVRIPDLTLSIYERAVRNIPWSVQLWLRYGKALERYQKPHEKIVEVFETALTMGLKDAEEFKAVWIAYLDYYRRKMQKEIDSGNTVDFKDIVDVFDRALTQMNEYFWGSESQYAITKYWIFFTAQYKKDIVTARQLWKDIIASGHKEEPRVWLDYANFEKIYGDAAHYRKALLSALSYVISEWAETFVDLLLTFEREEGTLETFEKSEEKCESAMKIINEKRKKMEEMTYSMKKEDKRSSRSSRRQSQQPTKNKKPDNSQAEVPVQMDSEGFKIPPPPDKYLHAAENRLENNSSSELESKKRSAEESDTPEPKKKKVETPDNHGVIVKHDPSKDDRTVFLSNLSYQIEDDKIREFCSPVGEIEEIRLVKDFKGRSKGYCYVVYKSELDAKKALEKDREKLDGRPVLVSPCIDKKSTPSSHSKLKFSSGLEKNKVFVKNVPFKMNEKELEDLFKEHGALKSVRIVTYRNGHSKGIAYVEYEDEASAANAVVKMDGFEVQDKVLSCAISNPPPRKVKNEFLGSASKKFSSSSSSKASSSRDGGSSSGSVSRNPGSFPRPGGSLGPRGRGRTQLSLVPRAVARASVGNQNVPNSNASSLQNGQKSEGTENLSTEIKPLSNSDFANMMKK